MIGCNTVLSVRWLTVVILLSFGKSTEKVSADMRPVATASDPWPIVITLIAISFQISVVAFQKLLCVAAAPGREIAIQDDLRKSILTASEQPHERLGLSFAVFLYQHLNSSLISHCETVFHQLTMKVIIHWLKIIANSR